MLLPEYSRLMRARQRFCQEARVMATLRHPHIMPIHDISESDGVIYFSMDYVTGENEIEFYTRARFKKLSARMMFYPSLLNKLVWRLANRYPAAYERRWAWMFPAWFLSFELEVLKDGGGE